MLVLGIETSCDETAAAVVENGLVVRSNIVASQYDLHGPFGGVVPEVAARAHAERITAVVDESLRAANCRPADLGGIGVVNRPGLVGALLVGLSAAKGFALAWDLPLVGVDHIAAHVYAAHLAGFHTYPQVALIVSGGHTCLYRVAGPQQLTVLGQTTDDAAGEAFDKVAQLLGLGFPGGPALARCAEKGDPQAVHFSRCGPNEKLNATPNFSFSGLKTAVYYHLRGPGGGRTPREISEQERADVAASFQEAACEILVEKTLAAAQRGAIQAVTVGGGVACNKRLRALFAERARRYTPAIEVFFPPAEFCTDNAAMSAGLAFQRLHKGERDALDLEVDPTPKRA